MRFSIRLFLVLGFVALLHSVYGKPSGFILKSGDALAPVQDPSGALVIESGQKAMIDWESFSIDVEETVRFQQMSEASYVLNRVLGEGQSQILGALESNGSVYLINPNGILIGPQGRIETAGFIASTLDVLGEDLSGKIAFYGESEAGICNQGAIHCPAGDVFLIGRTVENSGTISAPQGRAALFSGSDIWIHPDAAPEVRIHLDEPIDAESLTENPYALAIRHSGSLRGKEVYLVAANGLSEVSGTVAAQDGERGGHVRLLGDRVVLLDGAEVDASGHLGGGEVLIGGDQQGQNPFVKNARHTIVGKEVSLKADALEKGDGGKIVVWGDEATLFYGKGSVRGGSLGGDGGFAEVSGPHLQYRGLVDAKAPNGRMGELLLDPSDIVIGSSPTTGTWSGCPGNSFIFSGDDTDQILNTDLEAQLELCSVTISTLGSGGDGPNGGSITVSDSLSWDANSTLTLAADSFISIQASITNSYSISEFTCMDFTANGTGAGTNPGILLASGGILTTSFGDVTLNGTSDTVSTSSHGVSFNTGSIVTGGGAISVTGVVPAGGNGSTVCGIFMNTLNGIASTSGTIAMSGTSNGSGSHCYGVDIAAAWTTGTTGTVTFSNCAGGSGSRSHGVNVGANFSSSGSIVATDSIQAGGTGGGAGWNQNANFASSGGGDISITASSGSGYGIVLPGGIMSTTSTGSITLSGTISYLSTGVAGIAFGGGMISSVQGAINLTGSVDTIASNIGILFNSVNPVTSTSGPITISGINTGGGESSHGVEISASWTTGTTGTVTFSNCVGGPFFSCCGIIVNQPFSTSGDIVATNNIQGGLDEAGFPTAGSVGFAQYADFSSSGGGSIAITASSAGLGDGIQLNSGTMSTTSTGSITLNGTSSATGNHNVSGINLQGGSISTAQGAIALTGLGQGTGATNGISMATINGITSASGPITISGISTATAIGSSTSGVYIGSSWAAGTSETVTFLNCIGGSGSDSYGMYVNASFSTSGNIVATDSIQGGTGSDSSIGFTCSQRFSTDGVDSSIQITASSSSTSGNAYGISLSGGANLSTTGGGSIILNGTGGASSSSSHGINLIGGSSSITTATGSGNISLTGMASGSTVASFGVYIDGSAAGVINSTSGAISINGTSTNSTSGSYGVYLASAWTPATTGEVNFSGTGGNTGSSHGIDLGAAFTGSGPVVFSSCTGGTGGGRGINVSSAFTTEGSITATSSIQGNGNGGIGFASSANFTATGSGSSIDIVATASGTTGDCYGISLTGGSMSTNGGGSITLNGTGGASSSSSHGIRLTGGAGTISTTTGSGNIFLTGSSLGGAGTSYGILIDGSAAGVINSTSGMISLSGTSAASATGSYGVNIGAAWTPATTGTVTFSTCTGGSGQTSHGVELGHAFTGSGPVVFQNCVGGYNGTSGGRGINVASAFTTAGAVTATSSIQGNGNGGIGFASSVNFSATGASGSIAITASATGTTGACHGISLTAGSMSANNGGAIALSGTGGSSATASYGISLSGSSGISSTSGNIALTGNASGSAAGIGIDLASSSDPISSTSGSIALNGTSAATSAGSYGVSVTTNPWAAGTTNTLSIIGTGGPTGASYGINLDTVLSNIGPIALNGTGGGGTGSFDNSIYGNIVTTGGAETISGTTLLMSSILFDTTDGGTAPGGNIIFSSAITGNYNLTLNASGSSGQASVGGTIDLSSSSGSTGGALLITAGGSISLQGVVTTGAEGVGVNGFNGGAVSCTSSGGAVSVGSVTTSGGSSTTMTGGAAGSIALQPASGFSNTAQGNIPNGSLILSGNLTASGGGGPYGGSNGTINLSATGRSQLLRIATISGGNSLAITGGTIVIGPYEALTVFGNLTIKASTAATLSDMVATGALTVSSPTITWQLYPAIYQILAASGVLYNSSGMHVFATQGPFINTGTNIYVGTGANPTIQMVPLSSSAFQSLLVYTPQNYVLNYYYVPIPAPSPQTVQSVRTSITEAVTSPPAITGVVKGVTQPSATPSPSGSCRTPTVSVQAQ